MSEEATAALAESSGTSSDDASTSEANGSSESSATSSASEADADESDVRVWHRRVERHKRKWIEATVTIQARARRARRAPRDLPRTRTRPTLASPLTSRP